MQATDKPDQIYTWIEERRPGLLVGVGLALFWLACLNSARLPMEALLIGPGMMVAGAILAEMKKRESREIRLLDASPEREAPVRHGTNARH
jgi:hypothetical protein